MLVLQLRWLLLPAAIVAVLASVPIASTGVAAEADCIIDGATCSLTGTVPCPRVCCTGVPMRNSGQFLHCPKVPGINRPIPTTLTPMPTSDAPLVSPQHQSSDSSASSSPEPTTPSTPATTAPATTSPPFAPTTTPSSTPSTAPVPTSSIRKNDVESLQSTTSISNRSSGGMNGTTTIGVGVAALVGVAVLVAAVIHKRREDSGDSSPGGGGNSRTTPSTSCQFANGGTGLTPDNRSLDAILEGGGPSLGDSMIQRPVLSMASREDGGIARPSSPFASNHARISSPAQRGSNQSVDMAFNVDAARSGSSIHVGYGARASAEQELIPDKHDVVAL